MPKRGSTAISSKLLSDIRGGGTDTLSAHKIKKRRSSRKTKTKQNTTIHQSVVEDQVGTGTVNNNEPKILVHSILIPRQTSFLTPLKFLSFLLMNASFSSCIQTAGKPWEDAIRRILDMPSPGDDYFASKVTPLHSYVAKRIESSEMLPPGHLPSPLPLLGFFLSALLYLGGTVLLPRWNVGYNVLLNYVQLGINNKKNIEHASYELQNWFNRNNDDEIDPYFASSKKRPIPAVLVHEEETSGHSRQAYTKRITVCPLFYSPGYDDNVGVAIHESEELQHLRHPRRYYFDLDQKRYYYDPIHTANDNSQLPAVVNGGPSLHETAPHTLVSDVYTRGLQSNTELTYAKERYAPYSDITIPVPTLKGAFSQRITSPLVSLQLIGKLLSLLEEESIGRAFVNLARLGISHFVDAKRSIASAITLAEEVKGIDKTGDDVIENKSRFWALRPKETATNGTKAEWVNLSPFCLLPGDVFVIAPHHRTSHSLTIPVDALLLEGTCVTEEAALTGESVPQAKVPLDFAFDEIRDDVGDSSSRLDMSGSHRSSCVFAGTELLHSSNWDEGTASRSSVMFNLPPLPRATFTNDTLPAMFLSLRTGSYSSRGEIIQSLLKSRMNVGVSNRQGELDSARLIGVLALFAVGACIFVLVDHPDGDSAFKRIVQCTRLAAASVPSDLPGSLAECAHACSTILRAESDAVNSEAGALLESSKVDTIVFDKTGTLTADTQALTSVIRPNTSSEFLSDIVLAGGHTLVGIGDDDSLNLVGDPVDLASLRYTNWKYNAHEKCAESLDKKVKLWQIRSFPFDPIKKMSSAIVLVQNNGLLQLWVVVKGSPNKIRDHVMFENEGESAWYDKKVKRLGQIGYRSIGLGALDVTDTKAAEVLFPIGLPKISDTSFAFEAQLHEARSHARASLIRSDIENHSSSMLNSEGMMFAGFACFSAPMRSSTPRVVNELKSSAGVIMLTGDEPYASLAIAKKAGITNGKRICLLKTDGIGLAWEVNKKLQKNYTLDTAKMIKRDVEERGAVLIVSGDAINALLSGTIIDEISQYVEKELLPLSRLIAGASPNDKSMFVKWLQSSCKKNVLMCGDGVNDIAAMREATVSVAMLSGFGYESGTTTVNDAGDLRRKERLKKRYIGSNRLRALQSNSSSLDQAGVGDSVVATCARISHGINEGINQLQSEDKEGIPHHTTVFDVCLSSIKDEIKRNRDLKKGGSDAAKILAEEERLHMCLQSKATAGKETVDVDNIQTAECCLASSFTLLRPCISGVESILRTGVSAAACGISLYRKVALNCMLSCYNLATLYRNGFKYGKVMWQCELASIIFADRASFIATSTPRPRLVAGVRPSTTPFHASEVLSTISQAIIHIVTLTCAVDAGRQLEETYPTVSAHKGFSIKWNDSSNNNGASAGSVLATLVGSSTSKSLHSDTDAPAQSFFRRSPFQPNFMSNNVFIVSVFQNAVTTMVNHSGRPFSVSFLESRPLCLSVGLSFLLCIVCIAESFPILNKFIQLAPFPTKASKVAMLRLLLLNVSASYFAEYFSTFFLRHDIWRQRNKATFAKSDVKHQTSLNAADEEEQLLSEERQQNSILK
ncbi:hypothetical protein ACHAXR_012834 [Thalassiosira sp. AJA248-18]